VNPLDIENEIHERVQRLTAKIDKLAAENIRLTAENKAQAERIEKLESAKAPETTDDELDYLTDENERLAKNAYLLPFYKARMEREIVRQVELTAENKAQAERIVKLETFLTNLKDCASAEDITLIEQVLEGETP